MAITLAEAQQNAPAALAAAVIDGFRNSPILDALVFDDCVSPAGGATLTYSYRRLATTAEAGFREINAEFNRSNVTTVPVSTELKPLGGAFSVDRVVAKLGPAASGAVELNVQQKIKSSRSEFSAAFINGDSVSGEFDGLAKAIAGTAGDDTVVRDWSGAIDEAKAYAILEDVDDLLALVSDPSHLVADELVLNKVRSALRRTGQYTSTPGARGDIVRYGSVVLMDAGYVRRGGGQAKIMSNGLYAARLGLDGVHGVTVTGGDMASIFLPDFTTAGAVKDGEVELGPLAIAVKSTDAAARLASITI